MRSQILSKKKASAISQGIFLICLGILIYTNAWWPGILLALWATISSRQYLIGRIYQAILTSVIFLGLFTIVLFNLKWSIFAPVLFVIGGLFLIVKEYFFKDDTNGEEKSEEIQDDVDLNS